MKWTTEKIELLNKLVGTMSSKDIATKIGCTETALESARIKYCKIRLRRMWLKEDDEYLIKNKKKTNKEIAQALNRSEGAIEYRRKKLGIVKFRHWTEKEKEVLAENHNKPIKEIASKVNRTVEAVAQASKRYGYIHKKKWSDEDIALLEKGYYKNGPYKMAQKLHRTTGAILAKAKELSLDSCFDDMMPISALLNKIYKKKVGFHTVEKYIREGIPFKIYVRNSKKYKMVELGQFWKWAEENQEKIDFAKLDRNDLGYEPRWVETKRSKDRLKLHQKRWSVA